MVEKFSLLKVFLLFLIFEFATCAERSNGEFFETRKSIERTYDQMRVWMNKKWKSFPELKIKVNRYYSIEEIFKKNIFIATSLPNLDSLIDYMEMLLHNKIELFIYFWGFFYRLENQTNSISVDLGRVTKVIYNF
jgi:hypothetical protein